MSDSPSQTVRPRRNEEHERERPRGHSSRYDRERHSRHDRRHEDGSRERRRRRHSRSRSPRSPVGRALDNDDRSRDERRDQERARKHGGDGRDQRSSRRPRDEDERERSDKRGERQVVKHRGPLPSQADSFAINNGEEPPKEKEKPNFGSTGTLAAASNSIVQPDGSQVVLKYHEPPEARKPSPKDEWKLFVFKGADIIDTVELSHRSCWLVGRDPAVVDLAAEHPSVSKQHAVVQFRYLEKRNEYGDKIGRVRPYLIDLESANGTLMNGEKVPGSRYLELRDKDLVQFGQSTREYVLMLAPKE